MMNVAAVTAIAAAVCCVALRSILKLFVVISILTNYSFDNDADDADCRDYDATR